jgi:hypothetical protein
MFLRGQFGRPAVGVSSDSLSGFKGAIIFEKIRDAGGPGRVQRMAAVRGDEALEFSRRGNQNLL